MTGIEWSRWVRNAAEQARTDLRIHVDHMPGWGYQWPVMVFGFNICLPIDEPRQEVSVNENRKA